MLKNFSPVAHFFWVGGFLESSIVISAYKKNQLSTFPAVNNLKIMLFVTEYRAPKMDYMDIIDCKVN